jgi:hypothetical protein
MRLRFVKTMEKTMSSEDRLNTSFLNDSENWPLWPICPLVLKSPNERGLPKMGILIAKEAAPPNGRHTVYECDMYELLTDQPLIAQLEKFQQHPFTSFAEMLAAGWAVD